MKAMDDPKGDIVLEKLREILRNIPEITETDRAEADLLALSYQGNIRLARHMWVQTYNREHKMAIDLEDWDTDSEWDHAVARKATSSITEAANIIRNWLSGGNP